MEGWCSFLQRFIRNNRKSGSTRCSRDYLSSSKIRTMAGRKNIRNLVSPGWQHGRTVRLDEGKSGILGKQNTVQTLTPTFDLDGLDNDYFKNTGISITGYDVVKETMR
jgi:hypothetical protein